MLPHPHPVQSIVKFRSLRRPHAVGNHRFLREEAANPMLSYPTPKSEECPSLPHPPLPPGAPSPAHLISWGGGGTPRTNSSLFKVLEAKAEVMPAFLDWTRD